MRVVFDTNIFISAIIFGGNPRTCLELAREGKINLFVNKALLLEFFRKLKDKFGWGDQAIAEVIEGIGKFAEIVHTPQTKISVIVADPTDNVVLECAVAAEADFIVSGDKKHILPLKKFNSIVIVNAKEFLDRYYRY